MFLSSSSPASLFFIYLLLLFLSGSLLGWPARGNSGGFPEMHPSNDSKCCLLSLSCKGEARLSSSSLMADHYRRGAGWLAGCRPGLPNLSHSLHLLLLLLLLLFLLYQDKNNKSLIEARFALAILPGNLPPLL